MQIFCIKLMRKLKAEIKVEYHPNNKIKLKGYSYGEEVLSEEFDDLMPKIKGIE